MREVAAAMDRWATTISRPNFIFGLGDNFYPVGVWTVDDEQFESVWSSVFLKHESLRVPWNMILGNHDYMGNPDAQIAYTYSDRNPYKCWQLPDRNYTFEVDVGSSESAAPFKIGFFGFDSNGCQGHVQRLHYRILTDMAGYKARLAEELSKSTADWKVFMKGEISRTL
jgi:tartrate-resistant acid phosphatase type 5